MEIGHFEFYGPILAALLIFVFGPTVVVGATCWLMVFFFSRWKRRGANYKALWRTIRMTVQFQLGFMLLGGAIIGMLFGKQLFMATPIVIIMLTWVVGLISFLYYAIRYKALRINETRVA